MLVIVAVLLARFVNWAAAADQPAHRRRLPESDALVRTETAKHRQAVASVISWVTIALIVRRGAARSPTSWPSRWARWSRPPRCLVRRWVSVRSASCRTCCRGFFIITEKQYGFGDLVALTVAGIATPADRHRRGRHAARSPNCAPATVRCSPSPTGRSSSRVNLSKDWARAVVDIPVPTTRDLQRRQLKLLHAVCENAR